MGKKIIALRGIPAAGKSTWAKRQEGATVFNKDTIRDKMGINPSNWSKSIEKQIYTEERLLVNEALLNGKPLVIIDNTHLGKTNKHLIHYRKVAEKYGYDFEIKDFFVTREEAIRRDALRDKPVGKEVINKLIGMSANKGYPSNPKFRPITGMLPQAIILDIDGTLAFMDDKRSPYDYSRVAGDRANSELNWLVGQLQRANPNMKTIVLSGREDGCRKETEAWLDAKSVDYDELYMREQGDHRCDTVVKKELFHKHIDGVYDVRAVFDDRNRVVDMWRLELGLPTYAVWYGNF